jgi:hypothetical protein
MGGEPALVGALAALYSHVNSVPRDEVTRAAQERALTMRYPDEWVAQGCLLESPLIAQERSALVRSYAALLGAVHRS